MNILIPAHAAPDTFADNVAVTLRRMGHVVTTLAPVSNWWLNAPARRAVRSVLQRALPSIPTPEERWLVRRAREQRVDLVLTLTQSLSDETLFQLKRRGIRCVAWWGDTTANMHGMGLLSEGWDAIFLKDASAVAKFRRVGLNAHLLHEAMNPLWHKPVAREFNDAVVIAGSFYGYRQFLTMRLIDANVPVSLYGGRLPRWANPAIKSRHTGRFIVKEEKSRVFGSALACLNSTALSEGNSLNCRAFEIAGAGGLQLLEYRPAVTDCFDPGKELLVFRSFEELLEQIAWIRADPEGAREMKRAGARRALADHTYEHRLGDLLRVIE